MEYKIITPEYFKTTGWSGGTTTELFIFPQTADYQRRNFQFRLSKSVVEVEKSDFTSLPGISRKLMVLSGKITLSHEAHGSRPLNSFEVAEFDGGWKTSSRGKCTDFNLMTTGKTSGTLRAMVIPESQAVRYEIKRNCDWLFAFLVSGKINLSIHDKIIALEKDDLLVINKPTLKNIEISGITASELVFSEVSLES
ncbi:MAG: HutD family protein [Bacteroidales bacterium]|nr:HutD family protein [Bacteroidales bacterium]